MSELFPRSLGEKVRSDAGPDGGKEGGGGGGRESYVFISHDRCQANLARKLKLWLLNQGITAFIYEDDVQNGASHVEAVTTAIYKSRRCLLIITREFLESDYFVSEYTWAMDRQSRLGVLSCLPVLCGIEVDDLPTEFRHINHCLRYDDDDDFRRKLIGLIRDDIPIATQIHVTQTGVGLAWSFFYGYLDIVLPGFDERVKKLTRFPLPVYPKLVIVLPVSCRCPEMMPTEDDFRPIGYVKYKKSRAAIRERCYKNTVYNFQFKSRNGQQVHCHLAIEFATPLLSLYQMNEGSVAQLTKVDMANERHRFKEVVSQILSLSVMGKCHGKYLLVDYRDEDDQTTTHSWRRERLSQVVARAIENDMTVAGVFDRYARPVSPTGGASVAANRTLWFNVVIVGLLFLSIVCGGVTYLR